MNMLKNIIFDFGDILINLDKNAVAEGFKNLGLTEWNEDLQLLNLAFEKGHISECEFLTGIQKHLPNYNLEIIKEVWNSILKDFPLYRLEFLEGIKDKYNLFLLSNTDFIHIQRVREDIGEAFYHRFINCFEKVYYSFEIKMRKPDAEIYEFVLKEQNLDPTETLFIDDRKDNIEAAAALGIQTWHLQVGEEDVVDLKKKLTQVL
jgi:FMN phosphatase YigB (HAD superfamily)